MVWTWKGLSEEDGKPRLGWYPDVHFPAVETGYHHLLVDKDHAMLITDLEHFTKRFDCPTCGKVCESHKGLDKHFATCSIEPEVDIPKRTQPYGLNWMNTLLRFSYKYCAPFNRQQPWLSAHDAPEGWPYPYDELVWLLPNHVVYDIECHQMQMRDDADPERYQAKHHLASISMRACDHLRMSPQVETLAAIRLGNDPRDINSHLVAYLHRTWDVNKRWVDQKIGAWRNYIHQRIADFYARKKALASDDYLTKLSEKHGKPIDGIFSAKVNNAMKSLNRELYTLPVLGWNSSRYDLPSLLGEGLLGDLLHYDPLTKRADPILRQLGQESTA